MKSKKNLAVLLLSSAVILMSMSSGNFQQEESDDGKSGHNGSPGEQTCAKSNCHTTYALNAGPGSVTISAPGLTNWNYTPGQIYTINVTIAQSGMPLFGLGFEALLGSGANAGTLTAGTGSHALNATVTGNSRKTITHLLDAGLTSNTHTFSFTWLAPADGADVTFYAAGNAANNNGTKLGDYIYTTSQTVTALVAPIASTITANGALLLCNGASVMLSAPTQAGATFAWFDSADNSVGTGLTYSATVTGCYHTVATTSGGSAESTNEICVTASSVSAEFLGLETNYCTDASPVDMSPAQVGGTFSGPGVSEMQFSPAIAGPGEHTITYTITNNAGCTATSSQSVQVLGLLNAEFAGLPTTFCADADPVNLIPVNMGGQFIGDVINSNVFDPTNLPAGDYTIQYVLGPQGCQTNYSASTTVLAPLDASFSGLNNEYCSNASSVELLPNADPGVFSGQGVMGSIFSPADAGTGAHEIIFSVSDENGCQTSSSQLVVVNQFVTAEFSGLDPAYCENAEVVELLPSFPDGVFTGDGLTGLQNNLFDPNAGAGVYEIQYAVGEGSCATSSSQNVTVLAVDNASFTGLEIGYCSASDSVQLVPTIPNGVFEGYAVYGDYFYPDAALIGENTVTHTVTSENGCVNAASIAVFVYETANSNFAGLSPTYCLNNEPIILIPENAGGVFTGAGVVGNSFNPTLAGPGEYTITYFVDFVGCTSTSSTATMVFDVPDASLTGLDPQYCENDEAVSLVTVATGAVISGNGITGNVFTPSDAGSGAHIITCNVTDENNCTNIWTTSVDVIALPITDFTLNGPVANAAQLNAVYQWIDCDNNNLPIDGETEQTFTATVNGEYALEVSANGCSAISDCVFILVTNVEDASQEIFLNVYPNPAQDMVTFISSITGTLQIYNVTGKKVWQDNIMLKTRHIDLQQLPAGLYTVRFSDENNHEVISKLVKQ